MSNPLNSNTAKSAELQVMIWFLEAGWEVFTPLHDTNATDMAVRVPDTREFIGIQVKHKQHGAKNEGQLQNDWNDGNAPFDLLVFYQPSKSRGVLLPRNKLKKEGKNLFFFKKDAEGYANGEVRDLFKPFAFDFTNVAHGKRPIEFANLVKKVLGIP